MASTTSWWSASRDFDEPAARASSLQHAACSVFRHNCQLQAARCKLDYSLTQRTIRTQAMSIVAAATRAFAGIPPDL